MMEAGRELDALAAEKVMGWTVQLIVGPQDAFEEWRDPRGWRYGPEPKPYSTDIAAAWQVVEQMQGRELTDIAVSWDIRDDKWCWVARFGRTERTGYTAPTAICRAALAALSIKE